MEIFTFTFMGGAADRITLLPIQEGDQEVALTAIFDSFATFDANAAKCFKPEDKEALLGVIESGTGSLAAFNDTVREMFANMRATSVGTGTRKSSSKESSIVAKRGSGESSVGPQVSRKKSSHINVEVLSASVEIISDMSGDLDTVDGQR